MLRFNSKMKPHLSGLPEYLRKNKKLSLIAKEGFLEKSGCFFLKKLYKSHFDQYSIAQFYDETEFEAFVNSIHLSDYCSDSFLQVGLVYVHEVFNAFNMLFSNQAMTASLSLLENDSVVKFYSHRNDQEYLNSDLEGYDTPIMEMTRTGLAKIMIFDPFGMVKKNKKFIVL